MTTRHKGHPGTRWQLCSCFDSSQWRPASQQHATRSPSAGAPDFVVRLRVLLQLRGRGELSPAGLARVYAVLGQLLPVLLHVDGQLALQSELIPTLRADEVLQKEDTSRAGIPEPSCQGSTQIILPSGTNTTFTSQKYIIVSKYEYVQIIPLLAEKDGNTGKRMTE